MQPDSNPLLRELARSQREFATSDAHPDADQLAACAEEMLLPSERIDVLSHVAVCAECREVLRVATAGRPDTAEEAGIERMPLPARNRPWGWLPWATAATAIVAVTVTFLLHDQNGSLPVATLQSSSKTVSDQRSGIPAEVTQPSSVPATQPTKARGKPSQIPGELPRVASAQSTPEVAKTQRNEQLQTELNLSNTEAVRPPAPVTLPTADGTPAEAASRSVTVQASPAQNAMLPETMNAAPGSVGGPVAAGAVARQFSGLAARPQWRINEDGQVERSFGNGAWQQVLDAGTSKLRVVSVMGHSVWAAGDKLLLYRSTDNGATWNAVQLPPKGGAASAITHVRFQTPLEGSIDAADGSSWVTTDGGVTWK